MVTNKSIETFAIFGGAGEPSSIPDHKNEKHICDPQRKIKRLVHCVQITDSSQK